MNSELRQLIAQLESAQTLANYQAVAKAPRTLPPEQFKPWKIALLSDCTVDLLSPIIEAEALRLGLAPDVYTAPFNSIGHQALNPQSDLYQFHPDFILIFQWELEGKFEQTQQMVQAIRKQVDVPILINNQPAIHRPILGQIDRHDPDGEHSQQQRLNTQLQQLAQNTTNTFLLDLQSVFSRLGSHNAYDARLWHIARIPLSGAATVAVGREVGSVVRAITGKSKKCIVVDCDNTLWGGILGEDLNNGIKLGTEYPGSCFVEFQKTLLRYKDRGLLLAIASKNNEPDVLDCLSNHSNMVLRREDFAAHQINWEDKSIQLQRIASQLNIGLDALVFVDDNPFERNLIRTLLPEVAVLELPTNASAYSNCLLESGYFDVLHISEEDKKRTEHFTAQNARSKLEASSVSFEQYLEGLEMRVDIAPAQPEEYARISQLSQKTNQFNLNPKRYTPDDIAALIESNAYKIYRMTVSDKFGSLGIIAAAFVGHTNQEVRIDGFLMSCRALGRNLENTFLSYLMEQASDWEATSIVGVYKQTDRNTQTQDFFSRGGFSLRSETDLGTEWERGL